MVRGLLPLSRLRVLEARCHRRVIRTEMHSFGIDPGETTFPLVALGAAGKMLIKKFTQKQLLSYTAALETSLIGLEACAGAHFPEPGSAQASS